jgi:hypothetical protein
VQNLKRLGTDDHLVRWHIRPHRAPRMARCLGGVALDVRGS